MANPIIISPHLDDAVFSAWHLIQSTNSSVVTVFSGVPQPGVTTFWDRLCGEPNSNTMMQKRIHENDLALHNTKTKVRNLDFLDNQYHSKNYTCEEIAASLLKMNAGKVHYFAPLAASILHRHPDHICVRKVGQYLLEQNQDVSFYADIPYMQMPHNLNKGVQSKLVARAEKILQTPVRLEVNRLNINDQKLKYQAMQNYKTQLRTTNLVSLGTLLGRKSNLKYEITFHPVK